MARTALFLAAALALSGFASQASAAPCRDAAGKFIKCAAAPAATAAKKGPCHDASGKFIKCTADAKPAAVATASAKAPAKKK